MLLRCHDLHVRPKALRNGGSGAARRLRRGCGSRGLLSLLRGGLLGRLLLLVREQVLLEGSLHVPDLSSSASVHPCEILQAQHGKTWSCLLAGIKLCVSLRP